MQQRHDQPGAGRANGVPERTGAAIDVQFLSGDAEIALCRHRHHRKRFIDLEQIYIADTPADLVEQLSNRRDRRGGEPLRFLAMGGVTFDFGERPQAVAIGKRSFREDERSRTVGVGGRGRRRDGAIGAERRLQPRYLGRIDL
jgi:hypothetical protein